MSQHQQATSVVIDGLVIMKIIKHSAQAGRTGGTLLGLDGGDTIEVTFSFPTTRSEEDEERMVQLLKKESGVDGLVVGQYLTSTLGDFYTKENVEIHALHQADYPHSIFLVYDNVPTAQGMLSLKALRLTSAFMEDWGSRERLGSEAYTRLAPSQVFEELPLKVRNPYLVHAFLADVLSSKALISNAVSLPQVRNLPGGGGGGGGAGDRFSAPSIAASVGTALGASQAEVAAAELETDFSRLDLGTGAFFFPHSLCARACVCMLRASFSCFLHVLILSLPPSPPRPPFSPLPLKSGIYLEKHLEQLIDLSKQFIYVQQQQGHVAREIAQHVKDKEDWVAARRRENEKRRMEGLEPLPEVDPSLPFFKPLTDKSGRDHLDSLLVSAQISSYCTNVSKFGGNSFGKLFLASTLQNPPSTQI
jgi:hypothetical protein